MVVGVNLMSKSFAHTLPKNMHLTPTTKFLKSLSGQILPSEGIFHFIPIKVDKTKVYLSFYVFDIWEFDLLIGHPIEKLLHEARKGSINVSLKKSRNLSIPITRSLHVKTEMSPEQDSSGRDYGSISPRSFQQRSQRSRPGLHPR
jgi:hypothetical protein